MNSPYDAAVGFLILCQFCGDSETVNLRIIVDKTLSILLLGKERLEQGCLALQLQAEPLRSHHTQPVECGAAGGHWTLLNMLSSFDSRITQ